MLIQDVTALRTAERTASEREAQIQGLFDASSKGLLLANTDGGVLRVKPAMCRLVGYGEDELKLMRWVDLIIPEPANAALGVMTGLDSFELHRQRPGEHRRRHRTNVPS